MDNGEAKAEQPTVEQAPSKSEIHASETLGEKYPLQTMEFGKLGAVSFRDIAPEMPRPEGEIPMVMMTGWAMNQDVIGNTTQALIEAGQRVVPFDIKGGGKGVEGVGDSSEEINRQGELLKKWIEQSGNEKLHLVGQSMSALVLLSMLENNPDMVDKVASVVLVSPMGLGGKDSLPALIKRQQEETKRNNAREKTDEDRLIEPRVAKSFKEFMLHHPFRMTKEGLAMAGADEYNVLNLLKARGLKVGIIQGAQDQLNSTQRVVENIARQAVANSSVRPELIGEDGIEKIPEELKILPTDSEEEANRKRKAIIDIKMELQRTENKVPIDSFKLVEGGHEIFGPRAIAKKLIETVDYLQHPNTEGGDTLEERMKEKDRIEAEKRELAQARAKLAEEAQVQAQETSQPPSEHPQN